MHPVCTCLISIANSSVPQGVARSGIKPPSKLPQLPRANVPTSPTRNGLNEMSEAATNSRGAGTMGPPKHKPAGRKVHNHMKPTSTLTSEVPEPAAKRKTLQERAGEPHASRLAAPASSRSINGAVKRTAANGVRGLSQSTSMSRPASASSYNGSASVGFGARQPGVNSYGRTKQPSGSVHGRSKSQIQSSRPATSMTDRESEQRYERQGAYPFSISTNSSRSRHNFIASLNPQDRVVSAPTAHSERCFSETPTGHRHFSFPGPTTSPVHEDPADTDCMELSDGMGALYLRPSAPAPRGRRMGRGMTSGKDSKSSSSQVSSSNLPARQPISQVKTPTRSRQRSNTPSKPPNSVFLNRFTNDLAPVFDTESRMETMEREFAAFKQKMESEASQASDLKDTIKMLQGRGNYHPFCDVQVLL